MNPDLAKALLAVQQEAPSLQRDGINPHFRAQYVTLERLMETILPVLNKHGILLMQSPEEGTLFTRLIHAESGEEIATRTSLMLNGDATSQQQGSAITYARRYALMSMLGLVADSDDDGAAASTPRGATGRTRDDREPKELDPGRTLIGGAMAVRNPGDARALRDGLRALDPTQDWPAIEEYLAQSVYGHGLNELTPKETNEYWVRLANAVRRANPEGGDFPPVEPDVLKSAFGWAFNGTVVAFSGPESASEGEGQPATPTEETEA